MKYYGSVGYMVTEEKMVDGEGTGVYVEQIVEHKYYGDVLKNTSGWQNGEHLNDDLKVNVRISIVADPFACAHFSEIKYVRWMGARWKVKSIEPAYPRIILEIGGVYNDQTHGTP